MKTAGSIVKEAQDFQNKVESVFNSGSGKEVLAYMERLYVTGKLFHTDERSTAFALGQREVVMDLIRLTKGTQ